MEVQFSMIDGLLAFEESAAAPFLQKNPLVFHAEFHRICQQLYAQVKPNAGAKPSPLSDPGFDILREFAPAEKAQTLSDAFGRELKTQDKAANTKIEPSPELKELTFDLIRTCLTAEIEAKIESYLSCFFRIDHLDLMRSSPADNDGHSYKWHRDMDPMAKIHLMIYLTDSGADSPTTLFSSVADTRRCAEKGYVFPRRVQRVRDLNELFGEEDATIEPVRPILSAGDATLFTPSRILHRGIIHEEKYRDVIVVNILPSMNPRENEINRLGTDRLFVARSTLLFDPFTWLKPSLTHEPNLSIPEWAQFSHHFPQ